jgi:hypothetical protein
MDPHLEDLGFTGSNSEAGLYGEYRTSPLDTHEVQQRFANMIQKLEVLRYSFS